MPMPFAALTQHLGILVAGRLRGKVMRVSCNMRFQDLAARSDHHPMQSAKYRALRRSNPKNSCPARSHRDFRKRAPAGTLEQR